MQPLAPEQRDKPGASSYQQGNSGKSKGESVSGAERRGAKRAVVQRRRTVSTDLHISKTSSRWGSPRGEGRSPVERNILKKKTQFLLNRSRC